MLNIGITYKSVQIYIMYIGILTVYVLLCEYLYTVITNYCKYIFATAIYFIIDNFLSYINSINPGVKLWGRKDPMTASKGSPLTIL